MNWSRTAFSASDGQPETKAPQVWGHRGASEAAKENSVDAFLLGLEMGATGCELDVRRTADDQVVVHHDADLADGRLIIDLAAADLPSYVPLLTEVLAVHPDAAVNIEIKSDSGDKDFDPAYPVVDLVLEAVMADGGLGPRIITSFDDQAIAAVRARSTGADAVASGLITMNPLIGASFSALREQGHVAVMSYHRMITAAMVDQAARHELFLGAWTVNGEGAMDRMRRLGVHAIMTDTPDLAVSRYRS